MQRLVEVVLLMVGVGCRPAPSNGSPSASEPLRVREGLIAAEAGAIAAGEPDPKAFVFTRRPAQVADGVTPEHFVVARGAYFEVAPAPLLDIPRWYTALLPSGRVCHAQATEQVVVRTPADTPPVHVGVGLVLDGCLEPNAYGFLAVEGRHRDAARFDPIRLDRDALPPWAPSGDATVGFRFETDGPTYVVVEALDGGVDRWTLGNDAEALPGVEVDHDPAGDAPLLLEIDGHMIVVVGRTILERVDGALRRTGSLDEF